MTFSLKPACKKDCANSVTISFCAATSITFIIIAPSGLITSPVISKSIWLFSIAIGMYSCAWYISAFLNSSAVIFGTRISLTITLVFAIEVITPLPSKLNFAANDLNSSTSSSWFTTSPSTIHGFFNCWTPNLFSIGLPISGQISQPIMHCELTSMPTTFLEACLTTIIYLL